MVPPVSTCCWHRNQHPINASTGGRPGRRSTLVRLIAVLEVVFAEDSFELGEDKVGLGLFADKADSIDVRERLDVVRQWRWRGRAPLAHAVSLQVLLRVVVGNASVSIQWQWSAVQKASMASRLKARASPLPRSMPHSGKVSLPS